MEKILFITSTRIGDAVINSGVLNYLIETRPEARFTIASGHLPADLFRCTPRVDQHIIVRKQSMGRHWLGLWRRVVGQRWDLVVDMRSSGIAWMLRARERGVLRQSKAPEHKVREAGRALKLNTPPPPRLFLDPAAQAKAAELLPDGREVLAVCPSASLIYKMWPTDRFAELVQRMTAPDGPMPGARVAVFGGPGDEDAAKPLIEAMGEGDLVDFTGKLSLMETAACMERVRLFIGNDSGVMHIAAAAGAATLGLFGPSDERLYGPFGPKAAVVRGPRSFETIWSEAEKGKLTPTSLLTDLTVETAQEAARRLLERTAQ